MLSLSWLGGKTQKQTLEQVNASNWAIIQGRTFLFGIEWEFSPFSENKNSELQRLRKAGYKYYAISTFEDTIGYLSQLPQSKGNKYAAAIHLADRHSQGGVEIYCFLVKPDLYSFIALNESRPVPGHDYIGNKENVIQLAEDFANLQEQQAIRYIGNSGFFDMEEPLALTKAFSKPESQARIRTIFNQNMISAALLVLVLLYGVYYGIDYYLTQQQIEEEEARQALLNNPNTVYEKLIGPALENTGSAGNIQITAWLKTIGKLPLKVAGWHLTKVNCTAKECIAHWQRDYGNFTELFSSVPVAFTNTTENMDPGKPGVSSATTTHVIEPLTYKKSITRETLPKSSQVLRVFSSQLQDISLIENISLSMEKPKLFPDSAQGGLDALEHPVVRGGWSITHELWSLDSLNLYAFVVPETIEMQFSSDKPGAYAYALKGSYYALFK